MPAIMVPCSRAERWDVTGDGRMKSKSGQCLDLLSSAAGSQVFVSPCREPSEAAHQFWYVDDSQVTTASSGMCLDFNREVFVSRCIGAFRQSWNQEQDEATPAPTTSSAPTTQAPHEPIRMPVEGEVTPGAYTLQVVTGDGQRATVCSAAGTSTGVVAKLAAAANDKHCEVKMISSPTPGRFVMEVGGQELGFSSAGGLTVSGAAGASLAISSARPKSTLEQLSPRRVCLDSPFTASTPRECSGVVRNRGAAQFVFSRRSCREVTFAEGCRSQEVAEGLFQSVDATFRFVTDDGSVLRVRHLVSALKRKGTPEVDFDDAGTVACKLGECDFVLIPLP